MTRAFLSAVLWYNAAGCARIGAKEVLQPSAGTAVTEADGRAIARAHRQQLAVAFGRSDEVTAQPSAVRGEVAVGNGSNVYST